MGDLAAGDDGSIVLAGTIRPAPTGNDDRAFTVRLDFPACAGDLDDSGDLGTADLLALLAAWGPQASPNAADLDGDGVVALPDLLLLLAAWGPCS